MKRRPSCASQIARMPSGTLCFVHPVTSQAHPCAHWRKPLIQSNLKYAWAALLTFCCAADLALFERPANSWFLFAYRLTEPLLRIDPLQCPCVRRAKLEAG